MNYAEQALVTENYVVKADARESTWPSAVWLPEQRKRQLPWVLVAGFSVWIVIASVVMLIGRSEWNETVNSVQSTATTVSRLLADYSDQLLIEADLVRHQVGAIVGAAGPIRTSRAAHDSLIEIINIGPNVVSVWVGDTDGRALLTTREFPAPNLTASDREYFTAVRDDPDRLFVGNLIDNRYPAEALLINTSRRLSHQNGDMRGFVQVSLDPEPIRRTFQQVDVGFDASLWWIGPDGRALIREPALPATQLDQRAPAGHKDWRRQGSEIPVNDADGARTPVMGVSGIDGEARLFFWSDAPLYGSRIIVGVNHGAMAARWMSKMASPVGFGVAVGLASMVILWLQHRSQTRSLAYAARLEREVRERTRELDRAVEQKTLILHELGHRVRNAFATILALTGQMLRSSITLEEFRQEFPARLEALARTQLLLVEAENRGRAQLHDLTGAALAPYHIDQARITISGPPIELSSESTLGVSLILHELVTNAVKYGSLSEDGGSVSVQWDRSTEAIRLVWSEFGGPAIPTSKGHGFGTALITRAAALFGGSLDRRFDLDGLQVHLLIPMSATPSN